MRRAAFIVDVLIAAIVGFIGVIWIVGGFHVTPFGVRVSVHGLDRAAVAAVVLIAIRWRFLRGPFLRQPAERWRRMWARVFQPGADAALQGPAAHSWWHPVLATLGLAGIGAVLMRAQIRHMDAVPDLGDPLFSMWRLSWVYRQFSGDPRPFFDANIFHPAPLTLTMSDSMLLPAATHAPLLAAGIAPAVAYNILMLSSFLLAGLAAYLLVRRLTGSSRAAFIGGLLYAFYPYRWEHYSHLELQMTQWMPLALLFLHRFAESRRLRDMMVAVLCFVAQLYSSMYYGVFFLFFGATVFGTLVAATRAPWQRYVGAAAVAGLVGLVLAVPLARPYMAAQSIKGEREPYVVSFYSADLADYLRPHPRLALYHDRLLPPIHQERALFPGLTPLVLSGIALAGPLGPMRLAYAAGLVLSLDMSHGMKGVLYPLLYDVFPPMRGMRVPARFSAILGISLTVLGALGARRLLAKARSPRARAAVFMTLVAAVAIDLQPTLDLRPVWAAPPPIYETIAGRTDVVLAEYPFVVHMPMITSELPFMYFSIWHGLTMVNGYSGFSPPDYDQLMSEVKAFPDDTALDALRRRGATHVTVNCALMPSGCAEMLDQTDRAASLRLVTAAEWEGKPVRLYELLR